MRTRRRQAGLVVFCLVGIAWWMVPAAAEPKPESPELRRPSTERVVRRFTNALVPVRDDDDGLFAEAVTGELGEEMAQRVCDLCKEGLLDAEACDVCEPDETEGGLLVVDVVDEDGRPAERARVWMRGCEVEQRGWREYTVKDGTCQVFAGRRDGALWAQAEPVRVSVRDGEEEYIQLELASTRTGGLGVSIKADPEGVRVLSVMAGTPAAEMGLEMGDLIVEVDGLDTRDIDIQEFIRTMTGPENTEVDFVVQYQTDEGLEEEAMTIVRKYLEPSG